LIVVSIGAIHGGTTANIIPDDVALVGTIRSFKPKVRARMLAGVERTAKAVAVMSNAPDPEIKITEGTKAVINDHGVVSTAEKVLKAAFGDKFRPSLPVTPSEDYSEFINAGVPSMFFRIGVHEPERVAAAREEGPQLPGNLCDTLLARVGSNGRLTSFPNFFLGLRTAGKEKATKDVFVLDQPSSGRRSWNSRQQSRKRLCNRQGCGARPWE
jgi:hypothetical protein